MSKVGLKGGARTPTPAIVVNFRSETTGCDQPLFCSATVSDTTLLQGQGHHGSFSRADTGNFMAAIGPAFKTGFNDTAPVSNADIAPTLEKILGVTLPPVGKLRGRALTEALAGRKARPALATGCCLEARRQRPAHHRQHAVCRPDALL